MNKTHDQIQTITGVAVLAAIMVVFQVAGNYIAIGPVSINLSIIPIAICAIFYGGFPAALLGLFSGVIVLFSPYTESVFMPVSPLGTVLVCLIKCTVAGLCGRLVYKLFNKKSPILSYILCGIAISIVNSGLFAVGALIFFKPILEENSALYANIYAYLFLAMIGWNFIFEVISASIFVPLLTKVLLRKREPLQK